MKTNLKYIFLLLVFFIVISGCERDDICIDAITPHMIVRFYDSEEPTILKSASQLSVKLIDIESNYIDNATTDSIAIPLMVNGNSTQYVFTTETNSDTITINYIPEAIFVGRSCGFKSIFTNTAQFLTIDDDNWVDNIEIVKSTIEDETTAHVKIFH